jgi:hypothetical protein
MRHLLRSLSLAPLMIAASASAQTADPHAGHPPADSAKTTPASPSDAPCPCPMLKGKVAGKPTADAMKAVHDRDRMEHCRDMPRPDHDTGDGR